MTKTGAGCAVQFWYHMYGNSYSDMKVKLSYKGGISTIFEVSGNKGNKWNKAMIGLGAMDKGIYYNAIGLWLMASQSSHVWPYGHYHVACTVYLLVYI